MPFELSLPAEFSQSRWKAKIREKETLEPPHVTLLQRTQAWRINLRTGEFMDRQPDPSEVPEALIEFLKGDEVWKQLCEAWDRKYPGNKVGGASDE